MTTTRIGKRFESLAVTMRSALIPYIMAGDPLPDATVPLMHTLVESGGDLIELGVPFSDPMADGPVIQAASERALEHRVNLHDVIAMVDEFRRDDSDTPVILMTYQNPIEAMGEMQFVNAATLAGVDGVLVVDLPIEEADSLLTAASGKALDIIFLVSPTTSADRLNSIAKSASGFVYYVSLKGVTGAKNIDTAHIADKVQQFKNIITIPIAVGFGIHDAQSAAQVAQSADAVVVGSAIVRLVEQNRTADYQKNIADFIVGLRRAMDRKTIE
ncbi:MAG: tryptophan synthase subunit alpha [Chromatiales bacterium]|nr:tryptophan synthase subunit alpha [Chromatiales bacterium]